MQTPAQEREVNEDIDRCNSRLNHNAEAFGDALSICDNKALTEALFKLWHKEAGGEAAVIAAIELSLGQEIQRDCDLLDVPGVERPGPIRFRAASSLSDLNDPIKAACRATSVAGAIDVMLTHLSRPIDAPRR